MPVLQKIDQLLGTYGIYIAWLIALLGTFGSLFFSEAGGLVPCSLCWYQRTLMYPLAITLGLAAFKDDGAVVRYSLPLAAIGAPLALYHYLLQMVPALQNSGLCRVGLPCGERDLDWFGFINIPLLSFIAFALIVVCLWRVHAVRHAR